MQDCFNLYYVFGTDEDKLGDGYGLRHDFCFLSLWCCLSSDYSVFSLLLDRLDIFVLYKKNKKKQQKTPKTDDPQSYDNRDFYEITMVTQL